MQESENKTKQTFFFFYTVSAVIWMVVFDGPRLLAIDLRGWSQIR